MCRTQLYYHSVVTPNIHDYWSLNVKIERNIFNKTPYLMHILPDIRWYQRMHLWWDPRWSQFYNRIEIHQFRWCKFGNCHRHVDRWHTRPHRCKHCQREETHTHTVFGWPGLDFLVTLIMENFNIFFTLQKSRTPT